MLVSKNINISQELLNTSKILEGITEFVSEVRNYFSGTTSNLGQVANYSKLEGKIKDLPYIDLRELKAFTPTGMQLPMLDYVKVLDEAVRVSNSIIMDILSPFDKFIAEGLNDVEKFSKAGNFKVISKFKPHDIDGITMRLGKCFKKGNNETEVHIKNLYKSNSEMKLVYDKTDDMVAKTLLTSESKVSELTSSIADNLETLITRIEEDPDRYVLSERNKELFAKMVYTVAEEIEFYGVTLYNLKALVTALNNTAESLN